MADKSKKESTLYFFTSTGCAFCKRIDPIIEKLNNDLQNRLSNFLVLKPIDEIAIFPPVSGG